MKIEFASYPDRTGHVSVRHYMIFSGEKEIASGITKFGADAPQEEIIGLANKLLEAYQEKPVLEHWVDYPSGAVQQSSKFHGDWTFETLAAWLGEYWNGKNNRMAAYELLNV